MFRQKAAPAIDHDVLERLAQTPAWRQLEEQKLEERAARRRQLVAERKRVSADRESEAARNAKAIAAAKSAEAKAAAAHRRSQELLWEQERAERNASHAFDRRMGVIERELADTAPEVLAAVAAELEALADDVRAHGPTVVPSHVGFRGFSNVESSAALLALIRRSLDTLAALALEELGAEALAKRLDVLRADVAAAHAATVPPRELEKLPPPPPDRWSWASRGLVPPGVAML